MKTGYDLAVRGTEGVASVDGGDQVVVKWFGAKVSDAGTEHVKSGSGNAEADAVERAGGPDVAADSEGRVRRLLITAAVGSEDRKGDVIDPSGWDLEGYRRNPVFLWAHDRSLPPIGKASRVWVDGASLRALV